jgi:NAD(P)-dependent dehydrogenase (short-subunit alcohol dehydrogenase family)
VSIEQAGAADLRGRVALVTGGGRGLGRAFAQALAAAGASVAIAARSLDELAETVRLVRDAGGHAAAFPLDVSDESAVERCVDEVQHELGPIDLLVNNAGVLCPPGKEWEVDAAAWWRTFEINVRGPYLCARAVLPGMIARGRGRIVNVSSPAAFLRGGHLGAYGASKAALTHWTGRLAAQVEPHGIAVIAFGPSLVRTAMTEHDPRLKQSFDEGRDLPIGPNVDAFMLLASGRADGLTGRHLSAHDDLEALIARAQEIRHDDLYVAQRRL